MGDAERGYILELLLTKILFFGRNAIENVENTHFSIKQDAFGLGEGDELVQVIGLSATLPNLGDLAKWLGAELYVTEFRPVRLEERIWCEGVVYDAAFDVVGRSLPVRIFSLFFDNFLLIFYFLKCFCFLLNFCVFLFHF